MDIAEYRSQFTTFLFSSDIEKGAAAKVALASAGYDVYFFQDEELYFQSLKNNIPHIVILDLLGLTKALSLLLEETLAISPEIKFIFLSPFDTFDILAQYKVNGLAAIVDAKLPLFNDRLLWEADKLAESLFQTYQNEQLLLNLKSNKQLDKLEVEMKVENSNFSHVVKLGLSNRISDYKMAETKEELIQKFFDHTGEVEWLYFRYVTQVNSFVVVQSSFKTMHSNEGLSYKIEMKDLKDFLSQFSLGLVPPEMIRELENKIGKKLNKALPLFVEGQLEGVFVTGDDLSLEFNEEFSLFSLSYQLAHLEKRVRSLEIFDPVTGLYNKNYYLKKLEEEVVRAKRSSLPLSIVKVQIDNIHHIEQEYGEAVKDTFLKKVSELIVKSSRTNDFNCRLDGGEMVMVLPNCHRKGAAIRSERLRRLTEASLFLDSGQKLTISQGISEYPSLCFSDKSLDESASKALQHIVEKGGNKICIFKAPDTLTPDFAVNVDQ